LRLKIPSHFGLKDSWFETVYFVREE